MSTTTTTTGAFDVEAFRRAIHERDAEAQLALYAQDAEIVTIDRTHPPAPRCGCGAARRSQRT